MISPGRAHFRVWRFCLTIYKFTRWGVFLDWKRRDGWCVVIWEWPRQK